MTRSKLYLAVAALVVSRVLLTNINSAEWGDSYRILRASNFVREFSYPIDEKRPPLFSALLAIRPTNLDAVLWGRIFMLAVSLTALFVFYKLSEKLLSTEKQRLLALIFLFLNPVYLYWSLRIYADLPFSLLVMLCFYTFELWREKQNDGKTPQILYLLILGLICGLGILTRFEGYLLTTATLVGVFSTAGKTVRHRFRAAILLLLPATLLVLPWLVYKNPLTSSYFEEPVGRKYNLEMLLTYAVSYLFVLGIIPAFALVAGRLIKIPATRLSDAFRKYPHILSFVILESLLILAWPAAVPRLFVPIIPFLVIALVKHVDAYFDHGKTRLAGILSIILTTTYVIVQYKLRLQFLGPQTLVFIAVSALTVVSTVTIVVKQQKLFILSATLSMITLSAATIYLHKDVYRSIKEIATFSLREPAGKIIHNDTANIVSWYFPKSEYKNLNDKKYLTQDYLIQNNIGYVIITNEFDPNMEIDLRKRSYLNLIKEAKYQWGGKMFFTWLLGIQR